MDKKNETTKYSKLWKRKDIQKLAQKTIEIYKKKEVSKKIKEKSRIMMISKFPFHVTFDQSY